MSLSFNGTSSKLYVASNPFTTLPVSIFCWIKPNSGAATGMVGGVGDGSGAGPELAIYADGAGAGSKVKAFSRSASASVSANSTTVLQTSWQPALAVFTSTTDRKIYYASGAVVTDTASNSPVFADMDRIAIGTRPNADSLWFAGELAHFAMWTSALTQTDFDSLAAGSVPSSMAAGTLVDYWSLATQAGTQTGANGTVLIALNTSQGATDPSVGASTLTGDVTLDAVAPAGTLADAGPTSLSGDVTLDAVAPAGTFGVAPGTVTVSALKNWSGSLQTSVTIPVVTVLSLATGAQVLALTDQVTHATTADLAITSTSLIPGTTYMVAGWNADGSQRFAVPLTAA